MNRKNLMAAAFSLSVLLSAFSGGISAADTDAVTNDIHAHLEFYTDAEKTVRLTEELPKDRYVYYTVVADYGYLCRRFVVSAEYVDEEKLMLGDREYSAYAETYLAGDVTNDGVVNAEDLVRLMKCISNKHLNQYMYEVEWPCADTNMDDKVNSKDLVRTMRIVSGQNVESPACSSAAAAVESSEAIFYTMLKLSVVREMDSSPILTVINTTEELRSYTEKLAAKYPFDNEAFDDLIAKYHFANISDEESFRESLEAVSLKNFDGIYSIYNEEYFTDHTLVIVSTPDEDMCGPIYNDSELRGGDLVIMMNKYNNKDAVPEGGPAIVHSFIGLPRIDAEKVALEVIPGYYELLCENG